MALLLGDEEHGSSPYRTMIRSEAQATRSAAVNETDHKRTCRRSWRSGAKESDCPTDYGAVNTSQYAESYRIQTYAEYVEKKKEAEAKRKWSEDSWKEMERKRLKTQHAAYMPQNPNFYANSFTSPSITGKRSMSPIQEESASDELNEGEIQDDDPNSTAAGGDTAPEKKKRTKKHKRMKKDPAQSGTSCLSCSLCSPHAHLYDIKPIVYEQH